MKKTIIVIITAAMFIGGVFVDAQQVEQREIPTRQRPMPLETDNGATPGARPLVEDLPARPINDNATPTPARVRPKGVQDARELRIREKTERRAEMRDSIAQIREKRVNEIKERREAFKTKVQEMRDQNRRERAERLADNINRVNENLSSRYDGFLSAIELVLDKIEIRAGLIKEGGADLSAVYLMITEARKSIIDAREAIIEQKAKVYLVDIKSVETIQNDFRVTKQEMRDDHARLRLEQITPLRTIIKEITDALKKEITGTVEGE